MGERIKRNEFLISKAYKVGYADGHEAAIHELAEKMHAKHIAGQLDSLNYDVQTSGGLEATLLEILGVSDASYH